MKLMQVTYFIYGGTVFLSMIFVDLIKMNLAKLDARVFSNLMYLLQEFKYIH